MTQRKTLALYNIVQLALHEQKERRFYLTIHSTHFIYGYMASDVVKERGNPLPQYWLLFLISSKVCFYMHHPTDRITYTTAFVTPYSCHSTKVRKEGNVLFNEPLNTLYLLLYDCYTSHETLVRTRNSSVGPPQGTHRAMSGRSTTKLSLHEMHGRWKVKRWVV